MANTNPLRILFVRTEDGKRRLGPLMGEGNRDKTVSAPAVAVLLAVDTDFHDKTPELLPFRPEMRDNFVDQPEMREQLARFNGALQAGYFILAVRAAGLAAGPMLGFDGPGLDDQFFAGRSWKTILVVNIGQPGIVPWFDRLPRLPHEDYVEYVGAWGSVRKGSDSGLELHDEQVRRLNAGKWPPAGFAVVGEVLYARRAVRRAGRILVHAGVRALGRRGIVARFTRSPQPGALGVGDSLRNRIKERTVMNRRIGSASRVGHPPPGSWRARRKRLLCISVAATVVLGVAIPTGVSAASAAPAAHTGRTAPASVIAKLPAPARTALRARDRAHGKTYFDGLGVKPGKIKHVWLIILENKSYDASFTGLNNNTYLWKTLPSQGNLLKNYYGTGHFSLDNYISMTSGQAPMTDDQDDCPSYDAITGSVDYSGNLNTNSNYGQIASAAGPNAARSERVRLSVIGVDDVQSVRQGGGELEGLCAGPE